MSESRPARTRLLAALVFVLACLPFLPALGNGFVDWDDRQNFLDNPNYRGFAPNNLVWMFTSIHMGHYMPVTWLTSALDHALWGMNPSGYHLTNILLHGAVAALLFQLIAELLARSAPDTSPRSRALCAAAGALLYAAHPLRVESVAWATERRDVLSGALLLVSVLAYVRERRRVSIVAFGLSLLAKTSGMLLPLVLLVLDVYPLRRQHESWRARIEEKLPWICMAALAAWVAWLGQAQTVGALTTLSELGLTERLTLTAHALVFYLWKTVWPSGLAPLYPIELAPAPTDARTLVNVAVLLVVSGAAFRLRRSYPALAVAWISYLVLLAPVSGLAHAGQHFAADRYSYLPAMPAGFLVAGALLSAKRARAARPAACLAVVAIGALGALTWRQTLVWRDSLTLWSQVAAVATDSSIGPHRLGVALHEAGRHEEAIAAFERALERPPPRGQDDARYDLAEAQFAAGDAVAALASVALVLEPRPTHVGALLLAEEIHVRAGQPERAVALYERALARDPRFLAGRARLSNLHRGAGRFDLAVEQAQRALDLAPGSDVAHAMLGLALLETGQAADAVRAEGHLRSALASTPADTDLLRALARSLDRQNRRDEAELVRRRLATPAARE